MERAGILRKNTYIPKGKPRKSKPKKSHKEDWTWGKAPISSSNPSAHFVLQPGIRADGRVGERLKSQQNLDKEAESTYLIARSWQLLPRLKLG